MAWEIERRFLVRVPDEVWARLGEGRPLKQGYIRNGQPSVRIRFGESRGCVLTCKSGRGIRRSEVEAVVPQDVAEALMLAAENRIVEKTRFRSGPWEVDRFSGALLGLHLMEIEVEHEEEVLPEPPDGVHIVREVTDDKQFVSGVLARMTDDDRRRLVLDVYEGIAE